MRDNMDYLSAGGWKMKDAMEWVERHGRVVITSKRPPESDPQFHKVYISDAHKGHKVGTLDVPKHLSVQAVICKDCKAVCVYLFRRDKVYSVEYLKEMIELKENKLRKKSKSLVVQDMAICENYKHTIACLKRELKKRPKGK